MRAGARARLEQRLLHAWTRRGALARLLWPLAQLHRALLALRHALYRVGVLQAERLPVPVIVIGNVVAGGAGKTPSTLAVVEQLRARGWQPGIVSRGHGRRTRDVREVQPDADPRAVGDEPLLLRRRAQVPVVVGARRAAAGRALLTAHPAVDVLVCDDGLQHRALARDVEVAVFDARGIGNGWLLPAGPLREAWPRPLDAALLTEAPTPQPAPPADGRSGPAATDGHRASRPAHDAAAAVADGSSWRQTAPAPVFSARRQLAGHAQRADGSRVALPALRGQPLVALAGIARPEAFFVMLRDAGLTLTATVALPDHHDFDSCQRLSSKAQSLICTEKDAVKLWRHRPDALAVPLELHVPADFFELLEQRLAARGYHPRQQA